MCLGEGDLLIVLKIVEAYGEVSLIGERERHLTENREGLVVLLCSL